MNVKKVVLIIEVVMIGVWALWIGRGYLDFDSMAVPSGREYGIAVHPHYVWETFKTCGRCVFWNGFWNGGYPSFGELHGAVAHPLVIITTLFAGVINGSKLTVLISLMVAGMAQVWLGYLFGVRPWARLWGGLLVVAGGHLAGRMEFGLVPLVTSTAFCSLTIPALIQLGRVQTGRNIVILAVTLALAAVSGQGYVQIGLIVGVFPFALLLLYRERLHSLFSVFIAGGIAFLLAAYFLVPLLHFLPNLDKALTTDFASVQPLSVIPLNLVINDFSFLSSAGLGKLGTLAYLYINFIGWIPVLLAMVGAFTLFRAKRPELFFILLSVGGLFLMSSALPYVWIGRVSERLGGAIRYPSVIASLVVPFIILLAMVGFDSVQIEAARRFKLSFNRLFFIILFGASLYAVSIFNATFYTTTETDENIVLLNERLQTDRTQWVMLVFGEHFRLPYAAENGMKTTSTIRPSWWANRPQPQPHLFTGYHEHDEGTQIDLFDTVRIYELPENQYAYVATARGIQPCTAQAIGGQIDVTCSVPESGGRLVVTENAHRGWKVWDEDGEQIQLVESNWLVADVEAGEQTWAFRYRPWDVRLGLLLTAIGIILSIFMSTRSTENSHSEYSLAAAVRPKRSYLQSRDAPSDSVSVMMIVLEKWNLLG